jgi:hypothetical protein
MIFKGKLAQFPRIIYESKNRCEEIISHLLKTDKKMYAGITAEPYVKQIG